MRITAFNGRYILWGVGLFALVLVPFYCVRSSPTDNHLGVALPLTAAEEAPQERTQLVALSPDGGRAATASDAVVKNRVRIAGIAETPSNNRGPIPTEVSLLLRNGQNLIEAPVDKAGAWQATVVPGTWSLAALFPGCSQEQAVFPSALLVQEPLEGIRVELPATNLRGSIRGWLADCNGNPLLISNVGVEIGEQVVFTDSNGEFVFDCIPEGGKFQAAIVPDTIPDGLLLPSWQLTAGAYDPIGVRPFVLAGDGTIIIELTTGAIVSGVALDADGEPLAEATLSLRRKAENNAPEGLVREDLNYVLQTGRDGRFSTETLPEGAWSARFYGQSAPGFAVPDAIPFEIPCGGEAVSLSLEFAAGLGPYSVEGQVINLGDGPVEGLCFALWPAVPGLTVSETPGLQPKCFTYTDRTGAFRLQGLPEGAFVLGQIDLLQPNRELVHVAANDLIPVQVGEGEDPYVQWITENVSVASIMITGEDSVDSGPQRDLVVRRVFEHRSTPWTHVASLPYKTVTTIAEVPSGAVDIEVRVEGKVTAKLAVFLEPGKQKVLAYDGTLQEVQQETTHEGAADSN